MSIGPLESLLRRYCLLMKFEQTQMLKFIINIAYPLPSRVLFTPFTAFSLLIIICCFLYEKRKGVLINVFNYLVAFHALW